MSRAGTPIPAAVRRPTRRSGDAGSHGPRARRLARERFGIAALRPGQEQAIDAAVSGRDVACVMPTGSGKSAIYQVAGLLLDGPTVVVSPLLALQQDQVEGLVEAGVGAAPVSSAVDAEDREAALAEASRGRVEFLLLAPEQFSNREVLERLRRARPSLFVVDEAHCISQWGHDFRPDYLKLGAVARHLGRPRIVALTATASPAVRGEIAARLELRDPAWIVESADRPNIHLACKVVERESMKAEALVEELAASARPGIVYVATRRHAEDVARMLAGRGEDAFAYHAGMSARAREEAQSRFMDGERSIIVATSAFGMGIDKPDVRFVYHYDAPGSLDAYAQEMGRAGRDGEPARAKIFHRPQDLSLHRFFAGSGRIDRDDVEAVARVVLDAGAPIEPRELQRATGLTRAKLARATSGLERAGVVRIRATGEVQAGDDPVEIAEVAREVAAAQERSRRSALWRLEILRAYVETPTCRRRCLLGYFGEAYAGLCGACENCASGIAERMEREARPRGRSVRRAIALHRWIVHPDLGGGLVVGLERDQASVVFPEHGRRRVTLDEVAPLDEGPPRRAHRDRRTHAATQAQN
jgi:ATP-dependent DNA helicase RecQ